MKKIVVVFGAYGGVGSAVCRYNYVRREQVILVGRDENKLLKMAEGYDRKNSLAIVGDANNSEHVEKVFRDTREKFGEPHEIWVAVGKDGGWEQDFPLSSEENKALMREKLYPSLLQPIETIVPLVEELFKKQGHGVLVHLSSHAAFKTEEELPGNYTYRLLKQRAEALVNEMRTRLKAIPGNRATAVNLRPAIIFTPGTAKYFKTEEEKGAAVQPEDLAAWVAENSNNLPENHYFRSRIVV